MKTFLALGDSYTIGEQVLPEENFPNQTALLLKETIATPKIIATTGWTTNELDAAIIEADISTHYDVISLLIGVNNQYRGRGIENFEMEFEKLLQRATQFANNKPHHVFVLSIPDWGVTPFAEGRNRQQITQEIDAYNAVCKMMGEKMKCHYIDVTASQREDGNKIEFLAADGLHPSAKEYAKWAQKLAVSITFNLHLS